MAKKIETPSFESTIQAEQEVTNRDYNVFYKPKEAPENPAVKELIVSLSNIVPTLGTYNLVQDIKDKKKQQEQAVADFENNKNAFASLVKNGTLPEGANPHYVNKMMELKLANEAKQFQLEFNTYYAENNLKDNLSADVFTVSYEQQLKEFYQKKGLNRYDPLALNKAFFTNTSKFREDAELKHNAKRIEAIQQATETNAVRNYTGGFIELQSKEATTEDIQKFIKNETDSFIGLGVSPSKSNDMFLKGIKGYIGSINDEAGFDYARKVVDSLDSLKLGTGFFGGEKGSKRILAIQNELKLEISAKELGVLDTQKKTKTVKDDKEKQNLSDRYFSELNKGEFTIFGFVNSTMDDGQPMFSNKQKAYLTGLHNSIQVAQKVTVTSNDAYLELDALIETNPYAVRDRAQQLMNQGELKLDDYKTFVTRATNDTVVQNIYFKKSLPFNNYLTIFKDKLATETPELILSLPVIKNKFIEDAIDWYNQSKDRPEYQNNGIKLQKDLDNEIKLIMGNILSNNIVVSQDYEKYKRIFGKYGIFIPNPNPTGN